jgi:beta-galactosidase
MDACDELGIVVMNCIPGWQYFNRTDARFTELQYENIRRMMRRDRNHPCVLLWESSLNETDMPTPFIARSHAIAHEELPGDQTFSCGWSDGYDVFIQARQHGGCTKETSRPCVVSEYGDWEYYAQNAGLNQTAWSNLVPDHANSRQLRWHGEARLLQQATNFQEAHNDNRKTIAFADGLWVMFDYNRGYAPDIESSGCADLFRVPKPSYHFFRSQRSATPQANGALNGAMVFIASQWTPASDTAVRVFSNADEVALSLNGAVIARQRPDTDRLSTHLAHPPFTFRLPSFTPGLLEATAFIAGRPVASHSVRTPRAPTRLQLRIDDQGRPFGARGKDVAFLHASLVDDTGTLAVDAWENVAFGTTGSLALIGANPYSSEAGIASVLLATESRRPRGAVFALTMLQHNGLVQLVSAALDVGGRAPSHTLRYTTDGSVPNNASPLYRQPLAATPQLRAAIVAGNRAVALLSMADAKFRVLGSTAPTPAPQ